MATSIDSEKASDKIQLLLIKSLSKLAFEEIFPNLLKDINESSIPNTVINDKRVNIFLLSSGL